MKSVYCAVIKPRQNFTFVTLKIIFIGDILVRYMNSRKGAYIFSDNNLISFVLLATSFPFWNSYNQTIKNM